MSIALSRERVYLGEVIVMDTDGATLSAENEQASCGVEIRTESAGGREIDLRSNPPRDLRNVHVIGRPGPAKPVPIASMCLEDTESETGVGVRGRRDGVVAELLAVLNEKTVSGAAHLIPLGSRLAEPYDAAVVNANLRVVLSCEA